MTRLCVEGDMTLNCDHILTKERLLYNIESSLIDGGHSGDDEVWQEGAKEMLDDIYKRKSDMADEIYVVDVDE